MTEALRNLVCNVEAAKLRVVGTGGNEMLFSDVSMYIHAMLESVLHAKDYPCNS